MQEQGGPAAAQRGQGSRAWEPPEAVPGAEAEDQPSRERPQAQPRRSEALGAAAVPRPVQRRMPPPPSGSRFRPCHLSQVTGSESASPPPSKAIYPLRLDGAETGSHPSFSHNLKHLTSKSQRLRLQQTWNLPTSLAAWSHHQLVPLSPCSRPLGPRPGPVLPLFSPEHAARQSVFPICALADLSPQDVSPPGAELSISSLLRHPFFRKTSEGRHGQGGPPRAGCSDAKWKGADPGAQEDLLEEVGLSHVGLVAHTQWLIWARAFRKAPQLCYSGRSFEGASDEALPRGPGPRELQASMR